MFKRGDCLWAAAKFAVNFTEAPVCFGELTLQRRVIRALANKVLIEIERRSHQLPSKGLEPRLVQKLILADVRQKDLDRLPRLLEVLVCQVTLFACQVALLFNP